MCSLAGHLKKAWHNRFMEVARIAVISCTHSPHTPPETHDWVLRQLQEIRPTHFGHLGDLFDAEAASVHAQDSVHELEYEYEHAANFLRSVREVLPPDCRRWINKGNHDSNIEAADPRRIPKALRSLVHWSKHPKYGEEFNRWNWVEYEKSKRGTYCIGPCVFYHGFDCGLNSDETEGIQMLMATGGHSWRIAIRGHTHRPVDPTQMFKTKKTPLPWWYMNVGTCGPLKPDYMSRKDTGLWGSAIGVIECKLERPSRYAAKEFDAHLLRMN